MRTEKAWAITLLALIGAAPPPDPAASDYLADARALPDLIRANYAYLDDLPGGTVPASPQLAAEREAVHDRDSLLHYAEDMIAVLADHHALTARSFDDDWAIVPSYADLWIVKASDAYRVDAVRAGSPAETAGIRAGERLVTVDGVAVNAAVDAFWARLGLSPVGERAPFAARVLAAGRRDRPRVLGFAGPGGTRTVTLDSLYKTQADRPPLTVTQAKGGTTIRFDNSIGDTATIAAFDAAMAKLPPGAPLILDLTDTPSGGTSSIARAVMGWFVTKPMPYQMHQLPAEERETGIARQWVEYALPRAGKYFAGPVSVKVGRWTGSMGEGLAVGLAALGKPVCGGAMAGLKGGVYDFDLPKTGLRVKFPAERIYTVAGVAREKVVVAACTAGRPATGGPAAPEYWPTVLFFGDRRADLDGPATIILRNFLSERHTAAPTCIVTIKGHADSAVFEPDADTLSRRRAETVAASLAASGIARARMVVRWAGAAHFLVDNGGRRPEPQNRRVELSWTAPCGQG